MRRALVGACAALALGAAAIWGCASSGGAPAPQQAKAEHDWQHYEPDGGWVNYMPDPATGWQTPIDTATGTTPHSGLSRSTPSMTRMSPGP